MKCLVFSDSHGTTRNMRRAIDMHPDAEVIFFLGDGLSDIERVSESYPEKAFVAVRGNNDYSSVFRNSQVMKVDSITLEGKKILFTHGDLYSVKYSRSFLIGLGVREEADIVLFGHTHIPMECYVSDAARPLYLFNPGSISEYPATYGIMTVGEGVLFSHGSFL